MIDVKKLRELARRLRDTQADCVDSIEAADAILALCDRLEAAEKQQESLTSLLAECRDAAYVEGYAEEFFPAAVGSPDDVPAFVGQTVTELRTKLEAAEKDAGRYLWMAERFLGADFEWGRGEDGYGGIPALIIELPEKAKVWGCLDLTIDDQLNRTPASEGEQK